MDRAFTKNSTGVAPDGRWYAGDINLLQDLMAALSDFAQTHDVNNIRIGDGTIQLLKYGTAEARLSAALRIDGILRGLGGLYAGAFTTTARDAIPSGFRPYGLIILNTTANQIQVNLGTDAAPAWKPIGVDPAGTLTFAGQPASNYIIVSSRTGDTNSRLRIREDGQIEMGPGNAATDVTLARLSPGVLGINGIPIRPGYGTTLPGSPVDGQQHILVDNTSTPTYSWHMRYNALLAKWQFIGGYAATQEITAQVTTSANATYADLGGPGFTIPVAGIYTVEWSASGTPNSSSGVANMKIGIVVNNTLPFVKEAYQTDVEWQHAAMVYRKSEFTFNANDIVEVWYYSNSTGFSTAYQQRYIAVTPRTLG